MTRSLDHLHDTVPSCGQRVLERGLENVGVARDYYNHLGTALHTSNRELDDRVTFWFDAVKPLNELCGYIISATRVGLAEQKCQFYKGQAAMLELLQSKAPPQEKDSALFRYLEPVFERQTVDLFAAMDETVAGTVEPMEQYPEVADERVITAAQDAVRRYHELSEASKCLPQTPVDQRLRTESKADFDNYKALAACYANDHCRANHASETMRREVCALRTKAAEIKHKIAKENQYERASGMKSPERARELQTALERVMTAIEERNHRYYEAVKHSVNVAECE